MQRSSGILMPMSSLPSRHGIGTMGKAAYEFVDFLHASGQSWWQLLPLGPTGFGDSPYSSVSTFAGNPYYIDLDMLADEGLLSPDELDGIDCGSDDAHTDYGRIYSGRYKVLASAPVLGKESEAAEIHSHDRDAPAGSIRRGRKEGPVASDAQNHVRVTWGISRVCARYDRPTSR